MKLSKFQVSCEGPGVAHQPRADGAVRAPECAHRPHYPQDPGAHAHPALHRALPHPGGPREGQPQTAAGVLRARPEDVDALWVAGQVHRGYCGGVFGAMHLKGRLSLPLTSFFFFCSDFFCASDFFLPLTFFYCL